MSPSEQLMRAELDSLPDLALAVEDPRTAEQVLLVIAVLTAIWEQHAPDAKSRCLQCRMTGRRWLWRKRQPCAVRVFFDRYRLSVPRPLEPSR